MARVGTQSQTIIDPQARNLASHNRGSLPGDATSAHLLSDNPAAEKTVAAVFGEIVWLMSQDANYQNMRLGDLERIVMAPILLRQMRVFYDGEQPAAVVLYGRFSDTVANQLDTGASTSELSLDDWRSGERLRIMRVIAPGGGADLYAQETLTVLMATPSSQSV